MIPGGQFFDEEYALLYAPVLDAARTEREVAAAVAMLRLGEGARVLDLCCGNGRHAIPLRRRGLRVVGLDASAPLLAQARRRGREMGALPPLVRGDAARAPLRAGSFDAALCLFNSIGYGEDGETLAILGEARRVAPQLLLEVAHRDEHVRNGSHAPLREWAERAGARILVERSIDPVEGVAHATFRIAREGRADVVRKLCHRLFTATELLALLRHAGYARFELYGDYERRPFHIDAPMLLIHAR